MIIRLSMEQEKELMALASAKTLAETGGNMEPSGFDLVIGFGGPYGNSATAIMGGGRRVELGEVEVQLETR